MKNMSGHSHAKTVKRTKDANDAKRGLVFSKIGRLISIAAKEGENPEFNSRLRGALEEAKKYNLPKDNIERAIKKGVGKDVGNQLEEVVYEAIAPFNVNLIIEGITDNKNRSLAEIKQIIQKHSGKLAQEGSLKWLFERKGFIKIIQKDNHSADDLELLAIEAGAEETRWEQAESDNILKIIIPVENMEAAKKILEAKSATIESAELIYKAKQEINLDEKSRQTMDNLFRELDEAETVQKIYSNINH